MKKIFVFLFAIILAGISCKKKEKDTPAPEPTPAPTPAPGTRALFESTKFVLGTTNTITLAGSLNKGFLSSQDLVLNSSTAPLLDIGNVSLNGITFKKNLYQLNRYDDTTNNANFIVPQVWSATGSGDMGAFTFSNNVAYPNFNGYGLIADSFQINTGVNLPLNAYSGADEIWVSIFKQSNTSRRSQTQILMPNVTSVAFTAGDLAAVDTCKDAAINIMFYKNNVLDVSGKKCNFRTGFYYQKIVKFK